VRLSINQPAYLPWPGYFARIAASDVHIVLDHIQFEKNSLANRNKLRTRQGWCWVTVPVKTKGRFGNLSIETLEIDNHIPWARKHLGTLRMDYARAPHYAMHAKFLEEIYSRSWTLLNELLREMLFNLLDAFGIKSEILFSSQMSVRGSKSELILNLCRATSASTYISGPFGRDYLDRSAFLDAGINIVFHEFESLPYPQVFPGFVPCLSALDLLLNCGAKSASYLCAGSKLHEQ
jgi:hypothetical protein